MSASKEARVELSKVIKEKIQDAKSVVFVKFSGLTVAEDTELRREFRKNNVKMHKQNQKRYLCNQKFLFFELGRCFL